MTQRQDFKAYRKCITRLTKWTQASTGRMSKILSNIKKFIKECLKTFVGKIAEQIQIDLIDMRKYNKHNEGYNWIITMIDIFSTYAFTIAVKSKSGRDVLNGFVKLMKQFHEKFGKYPKRVQADEGREFFNINLMNI